LAHTQVWPALRNFAEIAPSTARSRSASSNTRNGALPPSSIETFFTVSAHWRIKPLPISVEPVKVIFAMSGLLVSSPPMSRAEPVTTLITPAGMPTCSARTP